MEPDLTPWVHSVPKHTYPKLEFNTNADVTIIGGGMTGILSAYMLAKEKKKVVLLESKELFSGATHLTTAFLTQSLDTDTADLVRIWGRENTSKLLRSHREAIDSIERIINDEAIDAQFMRCSNFIYANDFSDDAHVRAEYEALQACDVQAKYSSEYGHLGFVHAATVEMPNQAKFHPLTFAHLLAERLVEYGVRIYENTPADALSANESVSVRAGKHTVISEYAISATYEPFAEPWRLYFKKGMYVSYLLEIEMDNPLLPEAIFEDMENPYHYMRRDGNRIIIGGEDHRSDIHLDPEKSYSNLLHYFDSIFPDSTYRIIRRWHGPILEPIDGLAFIGPWDSDRVLYAFGFSGTGMTYAAIAARLFSDYIMGRKNPYSSLYAVDRIPGLKALITKGRDYTEEMITSILHHSKYNKK